MEISGKDHVLYIIDVLDPDEHTFPSCYPTLESWHQASSKFILRYINLSCAILVDYCLPGSVFKEKKLDILWIKCFSPTSSNDWLPCTKFLASNKSRIMNSGDLFGFGLRNFTACIL